MPSILVLGSRVKQTEGTKIVAMKAMTLSLPITSTAPLSMRRRVTWERSALDVTGITMLAKRARFTGSRSAKLLR